MLSAKEQAKLMELQKRQAQFTPFSDEELTKLEESDSFNILYPPELGSMLKTWSDLIHRMIPIIESNMRLIQEVQYWKEKAKNANIL